MKRWAAVAILIALGVTGWWAFQSRRAVPPQPRSLSFLFTCDVDGRLVPCGCFSGQYGGLTRIATLFGKGAGPDSIKVDVGDAPAGGADYEVIQYRYIQQAFASMGYEALNAGHREARLSAAQLRALKAAAPVPMLSANLLDKATGVPLLDPWKIVRRGPWRIALIGVLDPHGLEETLGEGLVVEEMDVALEKTLPKLSGQADFFVLLAFTDEAGLAKLARQFYELDVILGGNVSQPSQHLVKENRSYLLATTNEARAIGLLQTKLIAKNHLEAVKGEVQLVSQDVPQDDEIRALEQAYRDEVRTAKLSVDDLTKLREDMVPGVKATASYAGTQSCASCHPSAWAAWSNSGHARAFASLKTVGADADPNCIGCHTVGFGTLSGYLRQFGGEKLIDVGCESCHGPGSRHVAQRKAGAEALNRLQPARRHPQPTDLPRGAEVGAPGKVRQMHVDYWSIVDSANSHGPRQNLDTEEPARLRPVGESDCRKCHRGEFSRPFAWNEFWPQIAHGKEPPPAR
jgi:nitrate/TMAO reductase-like tetraheme cytochrome c subunit